MGELELKDAYVKAGKAMVKRLEDQGIDFGKETLEEGLKIVSKELFQGLREAAADSKTMIDDVLQSVAGVGETSVNILIEGINPKDNV